MDGLIKVGLFGSSTGTIHDITEAPVLLRYVTVRSIDTIDALTFGYDNENWTTVEVGPWGGTLGNDHTFVLGSNEYLTEVSGTYGEFPLQNLPCTVNSLTFVTSLGKTHKYGTPRNTDTSFKVPAALVENGTSSIVGFFARADNFVSAIGFYIRP